MIQGLQGPAKRHIVLGGLHKGATWYSISILSSEGLTEWGRGAQTPHIPKKTLAFDLLLGDNLEALEYAA